MDSTPYLVLSWIALAFMGLMLFLALFEPSLPYRMSKRPPLPLDSNQFRRLVAALGSGTFHPHNTIEVLANGEVYYESELTAIREATHSVNIEAYIFKRGKLTARFLEVLTERAKAGVEVNMVVDAVGSFTTWKSYFKDLTAAGGRVLFYHPIRWYTLPRINNRTHRELIVVDGKVGFIGGAGFGDHWMYDHGPGRQEAALARHHVPRRRAGGARPAGGLRRELAGDARARCWPTWSTSAGARRAGTARPWS